MGIAGFDVVFNFLLSMQWKHLSSLLLLFRAFALSLSFITVSLSVAVYSQGPGNRRHDTKHKIPGPELGDQPVQFEMPQWRS